MTPPRPPIQPYERRPAEVRPWDPRSRVVANEVIALIQAQRPDLRVEHIGSTAVEGLPGKGIVDLGTEVDPAEIPPITDAMYELGFGPQPGPDPWPPTRPMHVGAVRYDGDEFRIHFHVYPRGGDFASEVRFRDALRADAALAAAYAQRKREIIEQSSGSLDSVIYQSQKSGWIVSAYDRLGIPRHRSTTATADEESRP